jgi:hypothetical protein
LALTVVAATSSTAGCDRFRSLVSTEQATPAGEAQSSAPTPLADGSLESGYDRIRRLFLQPDAVPIIADYRLELGVGEVHDRVLKLSVGNCYAFVGYGQGQGFDVDLQLDGPSGQTVAQDVSPDSFPVIPSYCAPGAGFYALRVRAASGAGDVIFGVYELVGPSAQAERRLTELRDRYLNGARALGPVGRIGVPVGGLHEIPVALLPGRCYGFVAVADASLDDLDLELIAGNGESLSRDIATDAEPVITEVCPTSARTHRLVLSGYEGGGVVWWQLFEVDRRREP